ncbi:IclR family transcriptional regulator domain-containing protein [Phenylobacterium sp.]|jgi:IclR family pca regulon transcriptional regulator|uniref:IclR family transcriptional regulator domain-containing protein n=1 Tax=Phenylobacterium sp. TaxID=1871053 RepID=UPI002E3040E1|nr:IclR family transcriptional regulator C-terminal domain-containing protein [Phenylobacterium sp.]HEX3366085.1 IclR family transcriptional regulator C-terminal domain-containing protein [Phenylobacterium sp.]
MTPPTSLVVQTDDSDVSLQDVLDTQDGFILSLARGLSVIEAFRPGCERMTMAQVATACGLTRATARRFLHTLCTLGYVRSEGRLFGLTSRVIELAAGHQSKSIWELAQPILDEVAASLNEPVWAGVLDSGDVVCKVHARAPKVVQLVIARRIGLPAASTAIGRMLLARLPDAELDLYLATARLQSFTPNTVTDISELRRRLESARRQGWCLERSEVDERFACVAVPVTDHFGATIAALKVVMSAARATDEFVQDVAVPQLRKAAEEILAARDAGGAASEPSAFTPN